MQWHKNHISTIRAELNQLKTPEEKLHHLINEKRRFGSQNSSTPEVDSILRWYDDMIADIRWEIQNALQAKPINQHNKKKTKYSFKWVGKPEKLAELFVKMRGTLISEETTEEEFKAIFEAKPLEKIMPIKWIKSNSLLSYFIYRLSQGNNTISAGDNQWVIAERCFTPSNYLRQTNDNRIRYGKLPRNHYLVDHLF